MPTPGYAGQLNTYAPLLELSGNLMIAFSRNVETFPLNKYISYTPTRLPFGEYLYFNPLDLGRVRNGQHGAKWSPGNLRPQGFNNTLGFEARAFRAQRYAFNTSLDSLAVDVANWPIQKSHTEALGQEAMTHRTYQVNLAQTTAGNYPSTHVVASGTLASAPAGGPLDGGSTSDPRILRALQNAALVIQADSAGRVKQGDLIAVVNAKTASKLARSRELREYIMQSSDARDQITGKNAGYNSRYGLPNTLYTFNVVVEDTFYNPNTRGAAGEADLPTFPDDTIWIGVRKGGLDSAEGAASYSTIHCFMYEDMTVESKSDEWNRVLHLGVVDFFDTKVTAPVTGFLIQNIFA